MKVYMMPWCRAGPYLVGAWYGYLIHTARHNPTIKNLNQVRVQYWWLRGCRNLDKLEDYCWFLQTMPGNEWWICFLIWLGRISITPIFQMTTNTFLKNQATVGKTQISSSLEGMQMVTCWQIGGLMIPLAIQHVPYSKQTPRSFVSFLVEAVELQFAKWPPAHPQWDNIRLGHCSIIPVNYRLKSMRYSCVN